MYNIYAGITHYGAGYKGTLETSDYEYAEQVAYNLAFDEYQSNEGSLDSIPSYYDIILEYLINRNLIKDESELNIHEIKENDREIINEIYANKVEFYTEYFAIPTEKDINTDRLKKNNKYYLI